MDDFKEMEQSKLHIDIDDNEFTERATKPYHDSYNRDTSTYTSVVPMYDKPPPEINCNLEDGDYNKIIETMKEEQSQRTKREEQLQNLALSAELEEKWGSKLDIRSGIGLKLNENLKPF
jgi:hypothetical protein